MATSSHGGPLTRSGSRSGAAVASDGSEQTAGTESKVLQSFGQGKLEPQRLYDDLVKQKIQAYAPKGAQVEAAKTALALFFYTTENPFLRIDNKYLKESFAALGVKLPDRKALAGPLLDRVSWATILLAAVLGCGNCGFQLCMQCSALAVSA